MTWKLGRWVVALLAAGAATVAVSGSARGADDACARFAGGTVAGTVKNAGLTEISGLVASRRFPGVYWTHNDSGGKPEVFALGADGRDLGAYALTGASATDWEDIAIGPKHGQGSYLYAADIGDNAAEAPAGLLGPTREFITVYRVAEPATEPKAPGAALTGVERINLRYPASPHDAEAMLVDPRTGELVIVTKSPLGQSHVMVADAAALASGATVTLRDEGVIQIVPPVKVSTFPGTFVTGADISPDGSLILLRTYQAVLAFTRGPDQSVAAALHGQSCSGPQTDEAQGEAIAIAVDMSRYITISEGVHQPVNTFAIAAAAPSTTTTTIAPRSTSVQGEVLARTGGNPVPHVAAASIVLVAVLVARARRRLT